MGWQDNKLKSTRTNVTLSGLTAVPAAPDASSNWAQPWTYSNERDWFGTMRGEYDFNDNLTAYVAYGFRRSKENNSLANLTVRNVNGDGSIYRFDNARKDKIDTGEIGLRGKFNTGAVEHEWVAAANRFQSSRKNAYIMDWGNQYTTNLYNPSRYPQPAAADPLYSGNDMGNPAVTGKTRLTSFALGDTFSLWDKRLQFMLGARWQQVHNKAYAYNTGAQTENYKKSRLSPAVGAVYRITPNWSVYGNYIESLGQGATAGSTASINGRAYAVSNAGESLKPYVSKQKEIGTKYEAGGFGAGLTLFHTDKPRSLYVVENNTARLTSEGKDRHQGAEITVYGEVAPGVKLLGGVTLLDAKQKSTGSSSTDGKRTIGAAKTQANIGLEWEVPKVQGLAFDGRMVYTGSSYADAANTLKVGGWTRFDLGARYRTQIGRHEATFRARLDNVANKKYWASVGGYPNNGYLNAGAPRSFTLSASVDF